MIKFDGKKWENEEIAKAYITSQVATYIFVESTMNSTTTNYNISISDICDEFNCEDIFNEELINDIINELYNVYGTQIVVVDFEDEYFDITLYMNYCLHYVLCNDDYEE